MTKKKSLRGKDMYLFKKDGKGLTLHAAKTKKRKIPFLFA